MIIIKNIKLFSQCTLANSPGRFSHNFLSFHAFPSFPSPLFFLFYLQFPPLALVSFFPRSQREILISRVSYGTVMRHANENRHERLHGRVGGRWPCPTELSVAVNFIRAFLDKRAHQFYWLNANTSARARRDRPHQLNRTRAVRPSCAFDKRLRRTSRGFNVKVSRRNSTKFVSFHGSVLVARI